VKPSVKSAALPQRYVIDWADLKRVCLDSIAGKASKHFQDGRNRSTATEALKGGRWHGYEGGQLTRWLNEGYKSGEAMDLGSLIPVREKRRFVFTEDNGEFQLDRVLSGEDRYLADWTRLERIPGLAIEVEIAMAASTDSSVLTNYFRWLNQAIYSLETSGIDVQLDLIYNCASGLFERHDRERFLTQIRVKQEGEISDFNSWSAMISPASLRGLMFAAICKHAEDRSVTVQYGLGRRDASDWSVVFNAQSQKMVINPAWPGSPFPEARMTAQFKSALETIKRGGLS
jgi:hypothetical protein